MPVKEAWIGLHLKLSGLLTPSFQIQWFIHIQLIEETLGVLDQNSLATNLGRLSELHFLILHHINSCMTMFCSTTCLLHHCMSFGFQTCIFTVLTVVPKYCWLHASTLLDQSREKKASNVSSYSSELEETYYTIIIKIQVGKQLVQFGGQHSVISETIPPDYTMFCGANIGMMH